MKQYLSVFAVLSAFTLNAMESPDKNDIIAAINHADIKSIENYVMLYEYKDIEGASTGLTLVDYALQRAEHAINAKQQQEALNYAEIATLLIKNKAYGDCECEKVRAIIKRVKALVKSPASATRSSSRISRSVTMSNLHAIEKAT